MRKRKVLKLKKPFVITLKVILVLIIVFLFSYLFYCYKINNFVKLGYSKIASKEIIKSGNDDYVRSVGKNKLLNKAFESNDYCEKNFDNYVKIKFVDQKNIIKNINTLLEKGYSNSDISIILSHGNDRDVCEFAKHDRVKYLEEFYQFPYAKLKNYDRYLKYADTTGDDEKVTVIMVNLNMDKESYVDVTIDDNFSYDMLVNKYNGVSANFVPDDLMKIPLEYIKNPDSDNYYANKEAINSMIQMFNAAKIDGLDLKVNSSYRSYSEQEEIIKEYLKSYGEAYVKAKVSPAGFSEHHTGLAMDFASGSVNIFKNSDEYKWMLDNAYKYGYILRYPKNCSNITGISYEPWHYRYVGKEIAKYIFDHNITFEEYYVMFLDK